MKEKPVLDHPASGRAKGGIARSEALSPDQRSLIAKKAAAVRWSEERVVPKANYEGILKIGDSEIPCAVVEQGDRIVRVIVQREVVGLLTGSKKGNLDRYLEAKNLLPFVPEKFRGKSLDQASLVLEISGRKCHCYEGEDIVDLCNMYLAARKAGNVLLSNQMQLAARAEILVMSLAKTGITGLIDEATGYERVRAKDALQEYLSRVLRKELAAWVQRFPGEFFQEIYRLKKWPWTGSRRRPSVVGKYITNLVYSRLMPGIVDELEKLNPKNKKGNRSSKHHQWLTEEIGHPALAQHLYAVIGLMRLSDSWEQFMAMMDRAYPKRNEKQFLLFA